MNTPKVSVIIPVYNTEAFVEQAVRSIMAQTLTEIEILIVNDGSTDSSREIIRALAGEDPRITLLEQPRNCGAAAARNRGLEQMRGEYVYFMDSDDYLAADALRTCYEKGVAEQLDVVTFDGKLLDEVLPGSGDADKRQKATVGTWLDYRRCHLLEDRIYRGEELMERLIELKMFRVSPCLHCIRSAWLRERGLTYPTELRREDELFTTRVMFEAGRVGIIDRIFFERRIREGSLMQSRFSQEDLQSYLKILAALSTYRIQNNPQRNSLVRKLISRTLNPVLHNAWALPLPLRLHAAREILTRYPREVKGSALFAFLLKVPLLCTLNTLRAGRLFNRSTAQNRTQKKPR